MLALLKLYILFNLYYKLIEGVIPGIKPELTVSTLDEKLIERKRQDTMDMCRIFTEETKKLEKINQMKKSHRLKKKSMLKNRRAKRQAEFNPLKPTMSVDARRVESIVDKVYDDLSEKGEKIDYRRVNIQEVERNNTASTPPISGRRFYFAPMNLTRGNREKNGSIHDDFPISTKKPRFPLSIVPYFIDRRTYDGQLADMIVKAFDYVEKATCIRLQRLRERPTDKDSLQNVEWLYITNPTGIRQCVHSNERALIKGVQMIVLGYDCMSVGEILHEIMHVLGFSHEHNRPDRDRFISILWDNIKPGYKSFFTRLEEPNVENLPYDYASILHYPSRAFSRNGQVTILAQDGYKIGQRDALSDIDVEKINTVYSIECLKRNRQYLLKTCPSVVSSKPEPKKASKEEIEEYFENRIWPYGIVNYRINDSLEFTKDERENILAVINHIETETCIDFKDLTPEFKSNAEAENGTPTGNGIAVTENSDTKELKENTDVDSEDEKTNTTTALHSDGSKTDVIINKLSAKNKSIEDNEIKDDKETLRWSRSNIREKKSLAATGKKLKKRTLAKSSILKTNGWSRPSSSRRHATKVLVLTRSSKPGCTCPETPGMPSDRVTVEINADCFNSVNVLLHLFVHLLGLDHQHNSHDRDSFLHIVWDQLTEDVHEEMKRKLPPAASAGFAYDYQSVMHYPWLQIKNGRTNIMYPIWNDGWAMGNWQGLSSVDVQKLNFLYKKQCELRRKEAQAAGVNLRSSHS